MVRMELAVSHREPNHRYRAARRSRLPARCLCARAFAFAFVPGSAHCAHTALQAQLAALEGVGAAVAAPPPPVDSDPRAAMKQALAAMALYKSIGAVAASTARTLCKNALESPADPKFRTVNLANEKIRERLTSIRGGIVAMRAAGWQRDEASNTLQLPDSVRDEARLRMALEEIDAAVASGAFN